MAEAASFNPALARRSEAMAAWRRRSLLMRRLRRLLPAAIILILVLMAGWVVLRTVLGEGQASGSETGAIRMVNPQFFGRDGSGRGYILSAREARRDEADMQRVVLDKPLMVLRAGEADEGRVSADRGVYLEDLKVLTLEGQVVMAQGDGHVFRTERAVVDTRADTMIGDKPIEGSGPLGQISSSSYGVYDQGDRIVFRGGVRGRLNTR